MNGIDRIRDRMERDARAERDAIRAEGEQQAAALAAQYRAQAEELAKQAAARREQTAAESLRQADSADQLERRQCLLAERQRCIDLTFEQAASQLRTLPQEQYVQVLAHIVAETGTGSEELIFSPADREAVGAQVTERASALKPGAAFRLSAETRETGGGVVLKAGDIEYNCTFPAQLRALRQCMARITCACRRRSVRVKTRSCAAASSTACSSRVTRSRPRVSSPNRAGNRSTLRSPARSTRRSSPSARRSTAS